MDLRQLALHWLCVAHPAEKAKGVMGVRPSEQACDVAATLVPSLPVPGRPDRPLLKPPQTILSTGYLNQSKQNLMVKQRV